MRGVLAGILVAQLGVVGCVQSSAAGTLDVSRANPIDEAYRIEFGQCDRSNQFLTYRFPVLGKNGRVIWYPCKSDPSNFASFMKFSDSGGRVQAIYLETKMGLDLDGSWIACFRAGATDQCATSLMLAKTAARQCVVGRDARHCIPIDSDKIPYVVVPSAGPKGSPANAFSEKTKVGFGDYGVVISGKRVVPVIVADGGPFYKIGEGSLAVQRALGREFCRARNTVGQCLEAAPGKSVDGGVVTILFPGSRDSDLTADNVAFKVQTRGMALYDMLLASYGRQ